MGRKTNSPWGIVETGDVNTHNCKLWGNSITAPICQTNLQGGCSRSSSSAAAALLLIIQHLSTRCKSYQHPRFLPISGNDFSTAIRLAQLFVSFADSVAHTIRYQQATEHVAGFTGDKILSAVDWKPAAFSRRSHVNLRFSAFALNIESSSFNLHWQASTSSSSISLNIFLIFCVRLRTA